MRTLSSQAHHPLTMARQRGWRHQSKESVDARRAVATRSRHRGDRLCRLVLLPAPPATRPDAVVRRSQRGRTRRDHHAGLRVRQCRSRSGTVRDPVDHPVAFRFDHPGGDRLLFHRVGAGAGRRFAPGSGLGRTRVVAGVGNGDVRRRSPAHTRGSSQAGGDARPRHRGRGGAARTPGGAAQCRCPPPGHLRGQLRARHDGGRRAFPTPRGTECALRCRRHRGRVGRAFPARSGGPPMTTAVDTMHEVSHGLTPTTLAHVTGVADLQTRTDRKYLIPVAEWRALVTRFHERLRVLEMSGLRQFDYESVYFDTPDLLAYHRHAHGRRVRFKVRTRSYLDSAQSTLEIKTRGGRGETVKDRHQYRLEDRYELSSAAHALVDERLRDQPRDQRRAVRKIQRYLRSTLLDVVSASRLNCDVGLTLKDARDSRRAPGDLVQVEARTTGRSTPVETSLWGM